MSSVRMTVEVCRKNLIKKKAEWAAKINKPRAAAEMFLSVGETMWAVHIMGQHGSVDGHDDHEGDDHDDAVGGWTC